MDASTSKTLESPSPGRALHPWSCRWERCDAEAGVLMALASLGSCALLLQPQGPAPPASSPDEGDETSATGTLAGPLFPVGGACPAELWRREG